MPSPDYGPLTDLVKYAGILISSAGGIGLTWRRRAAWEPSEQDVPKGPSRVAGLLTAVAIGIVWTEYALPKYKTSLVLTAALLGVACLLFLLIYGYLIARFVFEKVIFPDEHVIKIIGGLNLTPPAKERLKSEGSIQAILKDLAYDCDRIWTRESRALAKQLFVLCFIGLNVCGTLALSCTALLFLVGKPDTTNATREADPGGGVSQKGRDYVINNNGNSGTIKQTVPGQQPADASKR
jgi:hypothetical protein